MGPGQRCRTVLSCAARAAKLRDGDEIGTAVTAKLLIITTSGLLDHERWKRGGRHTWTIKHRKSASVNEIGD